MPTPQLPRIRLKRAYEAPAEDDGLRLLVERLWPRGVRRDKVCIDHWLKDLAPSTELRRWYNHAPERWPRFCRRYVEELQASPREETDKLVGLCRNEPVTFVFAARNMTRNSAVVLRDYILEITRQK